MKTIFKNELPPEYPSWNHFLFERNENSCAMVFVYMDGRSYYINIDFAKARAYEELMVDDSEFVRRPTITAGDKKFFIPKINSDAAKNR